MKPEIFAAVLFVFVMVTAILAASVFYIRHWSQRQQRLASDLITEGNYFKRYIHPAMRENIDGQRREHVKNIHRHLRVLKLGIITIFGGVGGTVVLITVISNWGWISWIDLSTQEMQNLNYSKHVWIRETSERLPKLNVFMPILKSRGVTIISDQSDTIWNGVGRDMTKIAHEQWQRYLERYGIRAHYCNWDKLSSCGEDGVYIVLPSKWDRKALDKLIKQGSNILFYGPPAQVFGQTPQIDYYGMQFKQRTATTKSLLALVGDHQLTLGFDAGTALEVDQTFPGYLVKTTDPQAIGLNYGHFLGGEMQTRLYARSIDNSRLVWMDFSPNMDDHVNSLNADYFNGVIASIFRFLLRYEYAAWAMWPDGKQFAAMLSEDTEDDYTRAKRLIDVVKEYKIPITWFILSNQAQLHRSLTRDLAQTGEIACHGDSHANFTDNDSVIQIRRVARCSKVLKDITGITPLAFRPPKEEFNDSTLDAIANNGMTHYFAEAATDRAVPSIMRAQGGDKTIVSLPRNNSDDYELWHTRKLDYQDSIATADHELYWASTIGGFFVFDFHTQFINDDHLNVIKHYAAELKRSNVFLGTSADIARWWRYRSRLVQGDKPDTNEGENFSPVLLRVKQDGNIDRVYSANIQKMVLATIQLQNTSTAHGANVTSTDAKP